jgi:hypothetical protein
MLPFIPRFSMRSRLLLGVFLTLMVGLPSLAEATSVSATATPFYGAPVNVTLTIDDGIDPGNLVITLTVDPGVNTGDLRGFYAHIADETLLSGLSVSGPDVTASVFSANNVSNVGVGARVPPKGDSPCVCDFGIAIGQPYVNGDDFQTVTFTLSHATEDLTIDLFANQSFAVRLNGVGPPSGSRSDYAKLSGLVVVPEPTTAVLMLLGLAGLSGAGSRIRRV